VEDRNVAARGAVAQRLLAWPALAWLLVLLCGCHDALPLSTWHFIRGATAPVGVTLPTRVDALMGARGGSYVLQRSVHLTTPLRGVALTLAFPRLPSRAELEVNGVPLESAIPEQLIGYRNPGAQQWRIPAQLTEGPELRLRIVVADTWFQSSWIGSTPHLSTHKDGDGWYRFVSVFNTATAMIAFAFVLLLGISYLLVYLGDRRRVAYGWFAAQGLLAGSYPLLTLGVSQVLLGTHDLQSLSLVAVAAVVSIPYTHSHFGVGAPHKAWLWLGAANLVAALVVGGPFSARYGMAPVVVFTISAAASYQLVMCTRLLRASGRRGEALTLLGSWLCLAFLAGPDLVYWLGFGGWLEGLHGGSLGIIGFALLQAVAFSREHERSMASTDALNAELAARVASLELRDQENLRLADELRRQVAARSRQLSHALARLGRGAEVVTELAPGTTIDDRYRIIARLGDGGMAVVYEVERLEDRRHLALKLLRSTSDAQTMARFAREAHIASEISHPNLVAIHDIDFASGGFMYVVMDLVRGASLRDHADRYGDVKWALSVLQQAGQGLAALHERGVVHRDFKPDNVLLEGDGPNLIVRVSDFGIASPSVPIAQSKVRRSNPPQDDTTQPIAAASGTRSAPSNEDVTDAIAVNARGARPRPVLEALRLSIRPAETTDLTAAKAGSESLHLTQEGQLLGTPAYMAPELATQPNHASDPSRDVFSFGVMAYELLTGSRPYLQPPVFMRIQQAPIPPPSGLSPREPVDAQLTCAIERAVSVDPSVRPTITELLAALEEATRPQPSAPAPGKEGVR